MRFHSLKSTQASTKVVICVFVQGPDSTWLSTLYLVPRARTDKEHDLGISEASPQVTLGPQSQHPIIPHTIMACRLSCLGVSVATVDLGFSTPLCPVEFYI